MVDVVLTGSYAHMTSQVKDMEAIAHNPVYRNKEDTEDILGDTMYWKSLGPPHADPDSYDSKTWTSIATQRKRYVEVDAVKDENGVITTPAVLSANPYFLWRIAREEDWNTLLSLSVGELNILPGAGGSRILYATGLTVSPTIGNGDGSWGTKPSNRIQLVWA